VVSFCSGAIWIRRGPPTRYQAVSWIHYVYQVGVVVRSSIGIFMVSGVGSYRVISRKRVADILIDGLSLRMEFLGFWNGKYEPF
jgi:hypothetical protein